MRKKTKKIIKTKGGEDPVTSADLKVNEFVIKSLSEKYKKIKWSILSEENVKLNTAIPENNLIGNGFLIL